MSRNQELIEKYQRQIARMEMLKDNAESLSTANGIQSKISVYKLVIIDLQE